MYGHILPKKSSACSLCGKPLSNLPEGKARLMMRKKGALLERLDYCVDCFQNRELSRPSQLAFWRWEKNRSPSGTDSEDRVLEKRRFLDLLSELFQKEEYCQENDEEYALALLLSRGGVLKKRRGDNGSTLFIWEISQPDTQKETRSITFRTVPEHIHTEVLDRIADKLKEFLKST